MSVAPIVALMLAILPSLAAAQSAPPRPQPVESARPPAKPPVSGHEAHEQAKQPPPDPHAGHQPPPSDLPPFIKPITDADRQAAFPDVHGHSVHDTTVHAFVLIDQLEWLPSGNDAINWDTRGWVGRDRDRLRWRAEGAREGDAFTHGDAHVLYGRAISRWWDAVAGIRQDFAPGAAQTWAAFGVQGLAPYRFEVEATAYVGAGGRTHVKLETEYELLLTNHLVLQPLVEVGISGKADPRRHLGAGLTSIESGVRLRYEFTREVAPYVGVTRSQLFFGTADEARRRGANVSHTALVVGVRMWM